MSLEEDKQCSDDAVKGNSMSHDPHPAAILDLLQRFPEWIEKIHSPDEALQLEATIQLRHLLAIEKNPPIQQVVDAKLVPRLVSFLAYHHNPTLQLEAAWVITNIAVGTAEHIQEVIRHGAVEHLVQLLRSPKEDVKQQAVWALGNIAGSVDQNRDCVLAGGALQPLLDICNDKDAKLPMLQNAAWTLENLVRGKPFPDFDLVKSALPTLGTLLQSDDELVLKDACLALSFLSDDSGPLNLQIQAVLDAGVAPRIVELLQYKCDAVVGQALKVVGNLVSGDNAQTQQVVDCSVLPRLAFLLHHQNKEIRKNAVWALSNITSGTTDQLQAVVEANIMPTLVHMLKMGDTKIQREVAWALSNAAAAGFEAQVVYLAKCKCLTPLCDFLLTSSLDAKTILVVLEGIWNILRVGRSSARVVCSQTTFNGEVELFGGHLALERLLSHENIAIQQKARCIIRDYFH